MKNRLLSFLLLFVVLLCAWVTPARAQLTPVNITTGGTYPLTAGEFAVVTPACSGAVTFILPLQPVGSSAVKVKNQSQQQDTISGPIYSTGAVTSMFLNPGQMATFDSDGVYEDTYLPQNLIDTYTQRLGGSAYNLTVTNAAIVGGTTSPVIQIGNTDAGWYWVFASVVTYKNAATYAAQQFETFQVFRTNNTIGAIAGTGVSNPIGPITTITDSAGAITLPPVLVYLNGLDILTIYGQVSATPAGNIQVTAANILAVRWQ